MTVVLCLLALQGFLGAFDTLYFHEWRAKLPSLGQVAHPELKLHAARDFIYALIFGTLPWIAWQGFWAAILALLLLGEVIITLADFIVEDHVRRPLGGLYHGERVMHALMGIVYGAMLAYLLPNLWKWWSTPTGLIILPPTVPDFLRWILMIMALGVSLSGIRDLLAVLHCFRVTSESFPMPVKK